MSSIPSTARTTDGAAVPIPLVGLDSDGSVFDNMPVKFGAMRDTIVAHWKLEPVAAAAAEVIRFVNLESRLRGSHRFVGLVLTARFLAERPEPAAAGVVLPNFGSLQRYLEAGGARSNEGLARAIGETGDATLRRVLDWSRDLSARLAALPPEPPLAGAVRALERMRGRADVVVISQAPGEQLRREWNAADLAGLVRGIAGSEAGTKAAQLRAAAAARGTVPANLLVVGDAPGDRLAADETGAAFYPILPGREAASWSRFCDEAFDRFLAGSFRGAYEDGLTAEFLAVLPETPPWRTVR